MPVMTPNPAVIAAILSGVGIGVTIVGWFVQHRLTKKREVERDLRLKAEAAAAERKAIEEVMRLTGEERDILRACAADNAPMRGYVLLLGVSGFGSWVRAGGNKDFSDTKDTSIQARYLDAFWSLVARGYFRQEGSTSYCLTGIGYERAKP
jgi:hypothetical protein